MPHRRLVRSTPEEQGVSSRALLAFVDDVEQSVPELHSLMVVRHGAVVAEGWWAPCAADLPHELYSLSKSFTSTAVGLARAEGLLALEDLVLAHFPEHAPVEPDENLARMTVRHLLTMTTGHDDDPSARVFAQHDWVRAFLAEPVEHEPGSHFVYNTAATYILSAIVQRVTGQRVLDYLGPRLLDPLGITGETWEQCPLGIDAGGFGLSLRTEDVACFGQLYLADGLWQGRRLLPAGWVAEATRAQTLSTLSAGDPDWGQGYGYQFWRGRHGTYRGDGAFGQFCLVLPGQDAVVAITAGVATMQGVLDRVWTHLLPGMQGAVLAPDDGARDALGARLAGLRLDPPAGQGTADVAARISGRTVTFEPNPGEIRSARLEIGPDTTRVRVVAERGTLVLEAGHGRWVLGRSAVRGDGPEAVAASAVWTSPDTHVLTVRLFETPYVVTVTSVVDGDQVRTTAVVNVSFGPTVLASLVGTITG